MKKQTLIVFASLLLAVGTAYAQSSRLVADVPFDFMVGNKAFPAGEYTIKSIGMNGTSLLLQDSELKRVQIITPNFCASAQPQEESKLVFKVYGNHYYLSQIWTQGYEQGRELPMSRREMEEAQLTQGQHVVILASLGRVR